MSEGSETIITIVVLALATIFALIAWIERRPGRIVPDEPVVGDATDTPTMIHNTRRANWKRGAG